jgi:hypothetical protein
MARTFHLVMIKPSHYDDDGYVIQWYRSLIPSNTLAALNGLGEDCKARRVLGADTDLVLSTYDETNARVNPAKIMRGLPEDRTASLIALVGVQSNQFPRACDIAKPFRDAGYQVAIGGFHASGCISMLDEMQSDVQAALDMGITIFAGEAEDRRFDDILQYANSGALQPLYNFMNELPDMTGQPVPILPAKHIGRTAGSHSSFDLGRGCPFQCSFCTIINVQGRKSRFRSADDLERIIVENYEQGIDRFFITDDNFARNKDWEQFFDRLIELRQGRGMNVKFVIQVDTLCHRIDGFIDKAAQAGVSRVFIGLENINPDNLLAAKKKQNRIVEYREMLQAWKARRVTTYAGYILGFPGDTYESIMRDIDIVKRELPLDLLEFFFLTPLPGSEDHKVMHGRGEWMDPDMNKYDLNHRVSHHPKMSDEAWEKAYHDAWDRYYSPDHMATVMRRMAATGRSPTNIMMLMLIFAGSVKIEGVHPLESGFFRRKSRLDRRPGLPIEPVWLFYPKIAWQMVASQARWLALLASVFPDYWRIKHDKNRRDYVDLATKPVELDAFDDLEMISKTRGGDAALAKVRVNMERAQAREAQKASA